MNLAAPAWTDNDLVFPTAKSDLLEATKVDHEFKKLLAKAGLPTTYRVHDLRHSAATHVLGAQVDPRVVTQLMGWSQLSMLKRYQHVMDSMLTDATERLESFWRTNIRV